MNKGKEKKLKQERRHIRVRAKVSGTEKRPRLSVFKSNKGLYLQLINDEKGVTLVSAHVTELKDKKAKKVEQAFELGKLLATKAKEKNIAGVVFDRSGHRYHGRVEAVANGAREGGLEF